MSARGADEQRREAWRSRSTVAAAGEAEASVSSAAGSSATCCRATARLADAASSVAVGAISAEPAVAATGGGRARAARAVVVTTAAPDLASCTHLSICTHAADGTRDAVGAWACFKSTRLERNSAATHDVSGVARAARRGGARRDDAHPLHDGVHGDVGAS